MSDDQRAQLADQLKRDFASATTARSESAALITPAPCEGSISFTMPLLNAVLTGHKNQTRRPVRPVPIRCDGAIPIDADGSPIPAPARAGERLWVREKWARLEDGSFVYAVDEPSNVVRWISSRFMPRAAARHWLAVERVDVARLSAIDEPDGRAEGADAFPTMCGPRAWFFVAWDAIYGETEFTSANDPWVWLIAFSLVKS